MGNTKAASAASESTENAPKKKLEILINGEFYDITTFRHPGGELTRFYTNNGEDATAAYTQFHQRSLKRTNAILKCLPHRKADPKEIMELYSTANSIPNTPEEAEKKERYRKLTEDFLKLFKEFEEAGYFKTSVTYVLSRLTQMNALFLVGMFLITQYTSWPLKFLGIFISAVGAGQAGWIMHETGHNSFTGNPKWDRILTSLIVGLANGNSTAWWRAYHNRHHACPQRKDKDTDVTYLPIVALNTATAKPEDGKRLLVRYQSLLYHITAGFMIICSWKFYKSPRYAYHKGAWLDLICIALHTVGSLYVMGPVPYLLVLWLTSIYTLANLSLSHTHTPVTEEETHWVEHAFLHTTDIAPNTFVDWWMGYINYHVNHHLFPTMPQYNAKLTMPRIKKFAEDHGIKYYCNSYLKSLKLVLKNVDQVSKELRHGV